MNSNNHLLDILTALSKAKVEFIVAGGVAVVLQGVERATMDLDISLLLSEENVEKFVKVMEALAMKPRVPVSPLELANPESVRKMVEEKKALVFTFIHPENPFQQIDVFLAAHLTFEKLKDGFEEKIIASQKTKVLTKQKLLELKKLIVPPRDKDLVDILALEKILGVRK